VFTKDRPVSLRPFYFVVVVWGREYRDYFLEYCLPSLLSPNNIPALDGKRPAKVLFATTAEDWDAMRGTAIFRELEKHAEPVYVELPPKGDRPYWLHSIVGHKMCCDITARDKAYRVLVCPDSIFSDGAINRFHDVAVEGAAVVLSLVTPLTRTDLFYKTFAELGLQPPASARDTGIPITITARQVVTLAMRAMHGSSRINEWDAPDFSRYASTPWWRVPATEGAVMNGNFWDLFVLDYGAVDHDGASLNARGFDGDYIMRTIGNLDSIYFVRDSDELHVLCWASFDPPPVKRHRGGEFVKGAEFRVSAYGPVFNHFQRATLFMPTRVHNQDIGPEWEAVEARALRTLGTWLDTPKNIERFSRALPPHLRNYDGLQSKIEASPLPWWRSNAATWALVRNVVVPLIKLRVRTKEFFIKSGNVWKRVALALRGDTASIEKLRWHGRRVIAKTLGRPMA
jgi:hypothetical protein